MNRKKIILAIVSVTIILSMGVSMTVSMISISKLQEQNDQHEAEIFIDQVREELTAAFDEPIVVGASMNNTFTSKLISKESSYSQDEFASILSGYLSQIVDRFGYSTAYMIPADSKSCYTEKGFARTIDPDSHEDAWYKTLLNSRDTYIVNIDNDPFNNNRLTIYVNYKMRDADGRLIGVCGVGKGIADIRKILNNNSLSDYIQIRLISSNKVVKVSSEEAETDKKAYEGFCRMIDAYDNSDHKGYVFKDGKGSSYAICCYVEELDWFLVISNTYKGSVFKSKLMSNTLVAGVVTLAVLLILINRFISRREDEIVAERNNSETDVMTGLKNRRAFENCAEELRSKGVLHNVVVAIMDINGLKEINDSVGHDCGDDIIRAAGKLITKHFSSKGEVYRLGGDEFAFIANEHIRGIDSLVEDFKRNVDEYNRKNNSNISISIGIAGTDRNSDCDFNDLYKRADRKMYADKAEYYKDINRDRRNRTD